MDTLVVSHLFDIHFTSGDTKSAIGTLILVELYAQKRDTAEEPVQRAERTQETTEDAEDKDTCNDDNDEQGKLPRKQRSKILQQAFVVGVRKQAHATLESACGTDVFAKARDSKEHRQYYDERD